MAWFSTLALPGLVLVAALVVAMVWRRKRQAVVAPEAAQPEPAQPSEVERIYSLAEAQALADEAERAGECERAAELLESVGMFQRAISLYRRGGNIQKAAELELSTVALGRMAGDFSYVDVPDDETSDAHVDHADEDDALVQRVTAGDYEESDEDVTRIHDSAALAQQLEDSDPSQRASSIRPLSVRPVSAGPDTLAPASMRPVAISERPRVKSSAPPRARSERPRGPSVEDLTRMLGPSPTPDLGNIEIYYRLGLAHLAANQRDDARKAFLTVEDISPGYRDAGAYLEQLMPSADELASLTNRAENGNAEPRRASQSGMKRGRVIAEELRAAGGRRDDR